MKKFVIAGIIVLAILGIVFYFVVLPMLNNSNDNTSANAPSNNTSISTNENSKPTVSSNPVSTNTSGQVTTQNNEKQSEMPSTALYHFEWQSTASSSTYTSAENFLLAFLDMESGDIACSFFVDSIPDQFNVDENQLPRYIAAGSLEEIYRFNKPFAPQIYSHVVNTNSDGQYERHTFLASTKSHEARTPGGDLLPEGRETSYVADVVMSVSDNKVVFLSVFSIDPKHIESLEQQYPLIQQAIQNNDLSEAEHVRAMILGLYSYSPFIDGVYWDTVFNCVDYSDIANIAPQNDIAYNVNFKWRLVNDGGCCRVRAIDMPQPVTNANGYMRYSCTITYCTDHRAWGQGGDKDVTATLYICVDSSSGRIIGLEERVSTVKDAPGITYRDNDLNYNPTIELLLRS